MAEISIAGITKPYGDDDIDALIKRANAKLDAANAGINRGAAAINAQRATINALRAVIDDIMSTLESHAIDDWACIETAKAQIKEARDGSKKTESDSETEDETHSEGEAYTNQRLTGGNYTSFGSRDTTCRVTAKP